MRQRWDNDGRQEMSWQGAAFVVALLVAMLIGGCNEWWY